MSMIPLITFANNVGSLGLGRYISRLLTGTAAQRLMMYDGPSDSMIRDMFLRQRNEVTFLHSSLIYVI